MTAVNKLLNVVFACEIRGRLRCSAASIGYRGWIRKGFVHSPVTRLSRNPCQARNYHRRGSLRTKGGGESFASARRFLDPRIGYIPAPNARLSHLRGACLTCRRGSAAPRVAFDSSANRRKARTVRPPQAASGFSSSRERALNRAGRGSVFSKKQENTGEGRVDCTTRLRRETTRLAVGPQVDFVARRWHERAARLYLRHER